MFYVILHYINKTKTIKMTNEDYLKQWTKDELTGSSIIKKLIPSYLAMYNSVEVIDEIPFIDKATNQIDYWLLVSKLPNNKFKPRYRKGNYILYW